MYPISVIGQFLESEEEETELSHQPCLVPDFARVVKRLSELEVRLKACGMDEQPINVEACQHEPMPNVPL